MPLRQRFDPKQRKQSTPRQRIGFAFFWLLVLAYAYFIPVGPNWNTESHLFVTFAIVDHHSVNIDPYHVRLGDESYWHGHYYSDKAPGLSFLALPVYAALRLVAPQYKGRAYIAYPGHWYAIQRDTVYIRYAITYLLLIIPSALFALLLWLFFSQFLPLPWALALAAVYALGSIAYVYSTWFFSHQICAILLFSSFLLVSQLRSPSPPRPLLLALAGLAASFAVISEYPTVLLAALLTLYLVVRARHKLAALLPFLLGTLPPLALNLLYNLLAFGRPLAAGYMYVQSEVYQSHVRSGLLAFVESTVRPPSLYSLWQITFGTYRGLFLVSPVLLLFFFALPFFWKRKDLRPEFWLCLLAVVLYFLMDASRGVDQNGWSGGWSVASRHLTPMLPFMMVPMVFGLSDRRFRLAFVVLGALSVAVMFMIVAGGAQFTFTDQNPLVNEMLPNFFRGKIAFNWGQLFGLRGFLGLVPLAGLELGLIARLAWLFRHKVPEPGRLRLVTAPAEAGR